MNYTITTRININTNAVAVWNILMDFENYENWNPLIKSIKGESNVGEQLVVVIDKMTFKPIVIEANPNELFKWKGKLFIKGLFDGVHSFQLIPKQNGTTEFIHSEDFSGVLVGLFKGKLLKETKEGFVEMNLALKKEAEREN